MRVRKTIFAQLFTNLKFKPKIIHGCKQQNRSTGSNSYRNHQSVKKYIYCVPLLLVSNEFQKYVQQSEQQEQPKHSEQPKQINTDRLIGGKTAGLCRLRGKFNVPRFFYVNPDITKEELDKKMKEIFSSSSDYKGTFAVRSSAANEDSTQSSKAGQYLTILGVVWDDVYEQIQKVRHSYGDQNGTIIIQEFISNTDSDKAGVMFTSGSKGKGITVINSSWGLCKPVVDGQPCDEFYVMESENNYTISKYIKDKIPLTFENGQFKKGQPNNNCSLTDEEIIKLTEVGRQIQESSGLSQDIEWYINGNVIYIVQSRPITRDIITRVIYYDGANIQESFQGDVLPLSYSVMKEAYYWIYKNGLYKMGAELDDAHDQIFSNLLYLFHGKMYYNMNNWYSLQEPFPFKGNANNNKFENFITSGIRNFDYTNDDVKIPPIGRLKYLWNIFKNYIMLQHNIDQLIDDCDKYIRWSRKEADISNFSYSDCIKELDHCQTNFLNKWYLIGMNDYFAATAYNYLINKDGQLMDLIRLNSISTKQIDKLKKLVGVMKNNELLWEAIIRGDEDLYYNFLKDDKIVLGGLDEYLIEYGGRFGNEMKFETVNVHDIFSEFRKLLLIYSNGEDQKKDSKFSESGNGVNGMNVDGMNGRNGSKNSNDTHNDIHLTLVDRVYVWLFKKHATNRENLRLRRSNLIDCERRIFLRMGYLLKQHNKIMDTRDVFYLNLREILMDIEKIPCMKAIVDKRKEEYEYYKKTKPFMGTGKNYFISINGRLPQIETIGDTNKNKMKFEEGKTIFGVGCSGGIIQGIIKKFSGPEIPDSSIAGNYIMVAKNTDPGWTLLIGHCLGMIIESGGTLSHAAIVARELGKVTVIDVPDIFEYLNDGDEVRINGFTGTIELIKRATDK